MLEFDIKAVVKVADKRMITRKVTDDDNFLSLSSSAQALYLHLSMAADDDGFCNQVSICMFRAHASVDDLQSLLEKRYLYQFENGVIVIKHWRMANALRKDRYTPTVFQEEFKKLCIKENGSYTWLPNGCQMVATDKNRLDKNSIDNNKSSASNEASVKRFVPPTVDMVRDYCNERNNGIDPNVFVDFYDSKGWMVGKNKMKNWKAAVRTWENSRKKNKQYPVDKSTSDSQLEQQLENVLNYVPDGGYLSLEEIDHMLGKGNTNG